VTDPLSRLKGLIDNPGHWMDVAPSRADLQQLYDELVSEVQHAFRVDRDDQFRIDAEVWVQAWEGTAADLGISNDPAGVQRGLEIVKRFLAREAQDDLPVRGKKEEQDIQSRVAPLNDCVETTGSTAEKSPGEVITAERTKKRAKRRLCMPCEKWWPAKHRECPECGADTEREL
jgi:hypothetical protein